MLKDPVLIVIDVQQAFNDVKWGERNNPAAENNIAKLLDLWRARRYPIIHVQHRNPNKGSLFNPDAPGSLVKPEAQPLPGELVLYKDVNSAFIGTDLKRRLCDAQAETLVMVGLTTDHCVSTSARMAGNFGYEVHVVSDATATFERVGYDGRHFTAEQMHETALASLFGEFARVPNTEQVMAAFRGSSPESFNGSQRPLT